jgi:hypothetical protein
MRRLFDKHARTFWLSWQLQSRIAAFDLIRRWLRRASTRWVALADTALEGLLSI